MSGTRFLVITHHALTMSRMDRLFGVTMAERGVSQLVSVTPGGSREDRGGVASQSAAQRSSMTARLAKSRAT